MKASIHAHRKVFLVMRMLIQLLDPAILKLTNVNQDMHAVKIQRL